MALKFLLLPLLVASAVSGLVAWPAFSPIIRPIAKGADAADREPHIIAGLDSAVDRVNRLFEDRWHADGITPAEPVDELQVLRRLSVALFGSIPSLEEVRRFESDTEHNRLERWTRRMLTDLRFGEYFGERLGVALLGERENDHPMFRRERFMGWFGDELLRGRPYDEIAQRIIAETGSPTSAVATNFVTAQLTQDDQFANRLASRTVRALLGQRIDCAECHDHPFERWKQADFDGLAAYFAQARFRTTGVEDDADRRHEVEDRKTLAKREVEPRVPFSAEWTSGDGSRRRQLADWITHRDNRRFTRAIANRVWGLMFGRPFVTPVDDIPDPPQPGESDETALLDLLGADLQSHEYELRRTVLVIALSRPFRLASTHASLSGPIERLSEADSDGSNSVDDPPVQPASTWGVFPLVQFRPEQLSQAMLQVTSIQPIDNMSVFARSKRLMRHIRFLDEYGRLGENEFDERTAGVPQMVLQMNSRFTRQALDASAFSAAGRIATMSRDDANCLETCFLVCLTRRPTDTEREHFQPQLARSRGGRARAVEDVFWSLLNSPEFIWNH